MKYIRFGGDVRTVNEQLLNIFSANGLIMEATIRKILIVQKENSRTVAR
jgi:hypothetical protein